MCMRSIDFLWLFSHDMIVINISWCTRSSCISWISWIISGSNILNDVYFLFAHWFFSQSCPGKIQIFVSPIFFFTQRDWFPPTRHGHIVALSGWYVETFCVCALIWMGSSCELIYGRLFLCVYLFKFKNTVYEWICIPNTTWNYLYRRRCFGPGHVQNCRLRSFWCLFRALQWVWRRVRAQMYCKLLLWLGVHVIHR